MKTNTKIIIAVVVVISVIVGWEIAHKPQIYLTEQQCEAMIGKTPAVINSKFYDSDNPYPTYNRGQCTWYAFGRFYEVTGLKLSFVSNAKNWLDLSMSDPQVKIAEGADKISPYSIAVSVTGKYGHVIFIENITRDAKGAPEYIYFTESNADGSGNGMYDSGRDAILKKLPFSEFVETRTPVGYITANFQQTA